MNHTAKGIVVGGGIGGLVAAIQLATHGADMTLIDRNPALGGKLQDVTLGDYRFDFGPSTITMPWIFERVFAEAGEPLDPALVFEPLMINSRNFFSDGSVIDLSRDPMHMQAQLSLVSAANRQGFERYLQEITKMYQISEEHFFSRSFTEWTDFVSIPLLSAITRVHPLTTLDAFHRSFFDDPRLLAMMNRYATYVGSSPYHTPATLAMIAYLELVRGVYYIRGGNYRLIEALERLARKKGVKIIQQTAVEQILVRHHRAQGVRLANDVLESDFVISNVDYFATQLHLLSPEDRVLRYALEELRAQTTLSSSGSLLLAGVKQKYAQLEHHNLFYPEHYGHEFTEIFDQHAWPQDPAIYICNSAHHEPARARHGTGSNLYILVNVPAQAHSVSSQGYSVPSQGYNGNQQSSTQWEGAYAQRMLDILQHRWGLRDLSLHLEVSQTYGPHHIAQLSGAVDGALYGEASHGLFKTFLRPTLKDKKIKGLYYSGGSTHPGGGTPMVTISGLMTAAMVTKHELTNTHK